MEIDARSICDLYLGIVVNTQGMSFGSLVNTLALTHWTFWTF